MNPGNLDNLFRIMKLTGGKYVIVEDGEVQAVMMPYKEFENLVSPKIEEKLVERVNKIITQTQLTDEAADMIEEVMVNPFDQTDEITIEPLN